MSHDLEPAAPASEQPAATDDTQPPAAPKQTFGGIVSGIVNFITLSARVAALATAALWLKEGLHLLKARMHQDAETARRTSEQCGQAGVDPYFLGLFLEASQSLDRVAEASGELANAADQMETNARDVHDAHQAEYGGIHEAVQASAYDQPKPGFNAVR